MAGILAGKRGGLLAFLFGSAVHASFALAVCAAMGTQGFIGPDTPTYLDPARRLMGSGGGAIEILGARRPPGYPLILAAMGSLFSDPLLPTVIMQALGAGVASWIAFEIARRLTSSRAAHAAAAAAAALSPNAIAHSSLALTDSLHALAVLAGAFGIFEAFRRRREVWMVAGAISWATAQAIRPTLDLVILVLPLLVIALARISGWKPRRGSVAAAALILAAVPAAFLAGNVAAEGIWTLNRTDETNLRLLAASTLAAATGRDHREIIGEWEREESLLPGGIEVRRARMARARGVIAGHPLLATRVLAVNAFKILLSPADWIYLIWDPERARRGAIAAILLLGNVAAWLLAAAGARRSWRSAEGRSWVAVAVVVAAYVTILSAPVGYQGSRFRLPIDLIVAPLIGAGAAMLVAGRSRRPPSVTPSA